MQVNVFQSVFHTNLKNTPFRADPSIQKGVSFRCYSKVLQSCFGAGRTAVGQYERTVGAKGNSPLGLGTLNAQCQCGQHIAAQAGIPPPSLQFPSEGLLAPFAKTVRNINQVISSAIDLAMAQEIILGHFFAGFTLDTHAHVTTSAQKEAAQTTGNVLSM